MGLAGGIVLDSGAFWNFGAEINEQMADLTEWRKNPNMPRLMIKRVALSS